MIEYDRSRRMPRLESSAIRLRSLSRAEVRGLDDHAISELGIPSMVLMENAGRGAAEVLVWAMDFMSAEFPVPATPGVVVVCGPGNNGGDGAVVARHLESRGLARIRVVWTCARDSLRGDAPAQRMILEAAGIDQVFCPDPADVFSIIEDADWLVDGLFGTGLTRPIAPFEPAGKVAKLMRESGKPVLALDMPSGMDADTGAVPGECVPALVTATFVAPKIGFEAPGAERWTGRVEIVDIGLPRSALRRFEVS